MSARTIIAAPVIWFGSWLLSVMACSGCAAGAAFFGFGRFKGIKKGPQRPHAHRLNLGWPQPPPAGRLGTTTIRSLVIILRILQLELPKGCAVIPPGPRKSREGRLYRDFGNVTVFRPFGEWEFAVAAMREAARRPCEQTVGSPETKRRWVPNHTELPRPRLEYSIPG